jgi:hypothetical protein
LLIQETLAIETSEVSVETGKLHYSCDVEDLCKFGEGFGGEGREADYPQIFARMRQKS